MLIGRIRKGVEKSLRNEQAAYRKRQEEIFILRNLLEKSIEWQAPLYINFIDSKKAFDSAERTKVWTVLRYYKIPNVLVEAMKNIYNGSTSCVINGGSTSEWFSVETGILQVGVMSGYLSSLSLTGSCEAPKRIMRQASDKSLHHH